MKLLKITIVAVAGLAFFFTPPCEGGKKFATARISVSQFKILLICLLFQFNETQQTRKLLIRFVFPFQFHHQLEPRFHLRLQLIRNFVAKLQLLRNFANGMKNALDVLKTPVIHIRARNPSRHAKSTVWYLIRCVFASHFIVV